MKAEAAVRAKQGQSASGDFRLSIVDAAAEQAAGHAGESLYRRACSNPWRAGLVYLAGGCLFAAVITFSFLRASNSEILPMRFLILFWAMNMIGFLLFAIPGWFAVQWIRRRYQAKPVNDQSLTLDALWLLFGVSYAVGLVFEGAAWILSGLAAFAAYKAAVMLGFRAIAPTTVSTRAVSLLLLRVFSLGKRSEELFDAVTRHWRYLGHVQLITGPDLAAATIERISPSWRRR